MLFSSLPASRQLLIRLLDQILPALTVEPCTAQDAALPAPLREMRRCGRERSNEVPRHHSLSRIAIHGWRSLKSSLVWKSDRRAFTSLS